MEEKIRKLHRILKLKPSKEVVLSRLSFPGMLGVYSRCISTSPPFSVTLLFPQFSLFLSSLISPHLPSLLFLQLEGAMHLGGMEDKQMYSNSISHINKTKYSEHQALPGSLYFCLTFLFSSVIKFSRVACIF